MADSANRPRSRTQRVLGLLLSSAGRGRLLWGAGPIAFGVTIGGLARKLLGPSTKVLARARSLQRLRENLTSKQLEQLTREGFFEVRGGATGNRYRISRGTSMNVSQLDSKGSAIRRLCFYPEGGLAEGDVLLAQKVALELFEPDALAVANKLPPGEG